MHASTLHGVLEHLRKLTDPARVRELSDADLLERFCVRREEAAFTLLVQRHGPMVLAVCRRVLGNLHAAEDAFQATFLVLVRKAATIRKRQSVSSWLHGVASRIAQKARMRSLRQQIKESQALPSSFGDDPCETLATKELRAALDEEIERLPAKYRLPLVLCYLADKTHEQAAQELGWAKSSLTTRLAKARQLLHQRLIRRGFTASAGLLTAVLTEAAANAAPPSLLTLSTVRLAVQVLTGEALTTTPATVLAGGFVKGATVGKWTAVLMLLATLGFAAAVGSRLAVPSSPAEQEEPPPEAQAAGDPHTAKAETSKPRVDLFGDPLPPGAKARLGTVRLRHGNRIGQYAFSPDSKILAAASSDARVYLWDAATGCELRCLENDSRPNPSVAFSPDGKILASGSGHEVRRWETKTWKELACWSVKSVEVGKLFFSPDGRTFVCLGSVRSDNVTTVNSIVFLDTSTGRELYHWEGRKNP
jgi:RNA polymerase sigma factor (sigma-70 family)